MAGGAVMGAILSGRHLVESSKRCSMGLLPHDPLAWTAALVVLSLVLLGAALRSAMRAARIDPMTALRSE